MEHTKGKMIAEPKHSDLLDNDNPLYIAGIEGGKILFVTTNKNSLANIHRLVKCWNEHDELLRACKKMLACLSCGDCPNCPVNCPPNSNLAKNAGVKIIAKAEQS